MTKNQKNKWQKVEGFYAGCGIDKDGKNGSALYYLTTIEKTIRQMKTVYKITEIVNDVPEWAKDCNCVRIRFELK